MSALHIQLLGRFELRQDDVCVHTLGHTKADELFCYLLLHRERPCTREALASVLWEHNTTDQSKAYLRRALWQLRSTLEDHLERLAAPVLLVEPEWIQCNPRFDLWLDVEVFSGAYQHVRDVPEHELTRADVQRIEQALSLYEGDVLENYYQEWCLHARVYYQHLYLVMLDKITAYYEARGRYEKAVTCAGRTLAYDHARECTHRQLMRLRYLAGDRTGALRQYQWCLEALRADFDVEPSRETEALFRRIRDDSLQDELAPSSLRSVPRSRTPLGRRQHLAGQLGQLLSTLDEMREYVRREVKALECTHQD